MSMVMVPGVLARCIVIFWVTCVSDSKFASNVPVPANSPVQPTSPETRRPVTR